MCTTLCTAGESRLRRFPLCVWFSIDAFMRLKRFSSDHFAIDTNLDFGC